MRNVGLPVEEGRDDKDLLNDGNLVLRENEFSPIKMADSSATLLGFVVRKETDPMDLFLSSKFIVLFLLMRASTLGGSTH